MELDHHLAGLCSQQRAQFDSRHECDYDAMRVLSRCECLSRARTIEQTGTSITCLPPWMGTVGLYSCFMRQHGGRKPWCGCSQMAGSLDWSCFLRLRRSTMTLPSAGHRGPKTLVTQPLDPALVRDLVHHTSRSQPTASFEHCGLCSAQWSIRDHLERDNRCPPISSKDAYDHWILSFRQKVESPGLSKRRFCAFDWPKRRSACLGLSSFWRNDHRESECSATERACNGRRMTPCTLPPLPCRQRLALRVVLPRPVASATTPDTRGAPPAAVPTAATHRGRARGAPPPPIGAWRAAAARRGDALPKRLPVGPGPLGPGPLRRRRRWGGFVFSNPTVSVGRGSGAPPPSPRVRRTPCVVRRRTAATRDRRRIAAARNAVRLGGALSAFFRVAPRGRGGERRGR